LTFPEILVIALSLAGAAVVFLVLFLVSGEKKKKSELEGLPSRESSESWALKVERSVSRTEADKAREELRILELEREILGDAIRRLYEAHAEGKITEEERDRLASHYKERMLTVKDAISKNESIVALHELEAMQEDLIKLFNERFDELNRKIEELRTRVQIKPVKEISPIEIPAPTPTMVEVKETRKTRRAKRKPREKRAEPRKTEAEKRIEEIRAEVEKVLARLGQMEIET